MRYSMAQRGVRLALLAIAMLLIVGGVSVSFTRAEGGQGATPQEAAETLHASLTPEQRQALQTALAAYTDELEGIMQTMSAALPTTAEAKHRLMLPLVIAEANAKATVSGIRQEDPVKPGTASVSVVLAEVTSDVQQLQAQIEADLTRILTPDQIALYRAALAPAAAAEGGSVQTSGAGNATIAQSDLDPLLCFNAAQWANYGFAYITSAKAFAIMSAFNVDYGTQTPEALQSYISYNEAESFAGDGLQNLSTASVLLTATDTQVQNINGGTLFGVKGDADMITAGDRNDLALSLALTDYQNSGGVVVGNVGIGGNYFAYFSYAYGVIADFYLDGSRSRTGGCF
jgi:hypothetical protein